MHNLAWKLALVLSGDADPSLLETYEHERRPSLECNARRSLENAANHFAIIALLGVSHEQTDEENLAALRRLWSGEPQDAEHRAAVQRALRAQSMEFNEHNVEYGYSYASAAIVPDGSPPRHNADPIRVYQPSTRPGSPLPHAWVEDRDGARRAIRDLVAPGRFLLIAGEDGHAWVEAARAVAADTGLPLDAIRLGHLDGDVLDPQCTWARHRETGADGAVLVRPDRFVAWRGPGAAAEPARELTAALGEVLGRPLHAKASGPPHVMA